MSNAIAFCGPIGSGKTSLSKEISKILRWKYIGFGNYVRKEMTKLGFDTPSREQLQSFGESIILSGTEVFCLSILRDSAWNMGDGVVFDGVRHSEILNSLRSIFDPSKVFLIYIEIDEFTVNDRLAKRGSMEDIHALQFHSTERQVKEVLKSGADLIVDGKINIDENAYQICKWLNMQ